MTAWVFWNSGINFINACAVYYVVQHVRCVLLSFVVFAFVFALRKTVLKNSTEKQGVPKGCIMELVHSCFVYRQDEVF